MRKWLHTLITALVALFSFLYGTRHGAECRFLVANKSERQSQSKRVAQRRAL